jgi:ribonuclease HII
MICGVDEAGRGPIIGNLVIAGVVFENDNQLVELNVRDSKKITRQKRKRLADIIKKIAENYKIMNITATDIDDMRNVMTLNEIEVNAFRKIIHDLKPDICYVDAADVNEQRFGFEILSTLSFKPKIISKHKADDIYPIVGAASILAKTTRDHHIKKIEIELQKKLNLPLGSGYPADPLTKIFLKTWFDTYGELPPYVRHSWKTAQNILSKKNMKTLDDFKY